MYGLLSSKPLCFSLIKATTERMENNTQIENHPKVFSIDLFVTFCPLLGFNQFFQNLDYTQIVIVTKTPIICCKNNSSNRRFVKIFSYPMYLDVFCFADFATKTDSLHMQPKLFCSAFDIYHFIKVQCGSHRRKFIVNVDSQKTEAIRAEYITIDFALRQNLDQTDFNLFLVQCVSRNAVFKCL